MYIVLLSGGSGKRLWPLSNDLCSKQYIKLMNHDEEQENREKCSMLQRAPRYIPGSHAFLCIPAFQERCQGR